MKINLEKKQKRIKEEKGAISALALFTVLMFSVILLGVYFGITTMQKAQLKSDIRIQEIYGHEVEQRDEIYEQLALLKIANVKGRTFSKQTTLEDSDGNRVVVPAGFKIATDSGNNVTEGIVIEDDDIKTDGNGQKRGNQYVWIPVSNIDGKGTNKIKKSNGTQIEITLGRYEFADGTKVYQDNEEKDLNNGAPLPKGTEILRQKAENYEDETLINSRFQELKEYRPGNDVNDETGKNRTARELEKFVNSVEANGGYYIARYEASYGEKDGKPNSKVSINPNETSSAPTQEGYLWNNITQIDAAGACDGMYTTVQSDLINSYAWDTAIVYIQKFSIQTTYSQQTSRNKDLANTGKNSDEVCKIHDMASNCLEWTTEYSTNTYSSIAYPCVCRGGYYNNSNNYTSDRNSVNATRSNKNYTFRPILYISNLAS